MFFLANLEFDGVVLLGNHIFGDFLVIFESIVVVVAVVTKWLVLAQSTATPVVGFPWYEGHTKWRFVGCFSGGQIFGVGEIFRYFNQRDDCCFLFEARVRFGMVAIFVFLLLEGPACFVVLVNWVGR